MPEDNKLKIAFLWHMHQPFYLNPESNQLMMPWVRLHGVKDYLDMPLLAARYGVKCTFNLVPSLLDQIEMYSRGISDRHLELSRIPALALTFDMKEEILKSFFDANAPTMIEPFMRFRQLKRKYENSASNIKLAVEIFSTAEWRDLQVWSNLVWIDPLFRQESPIKELFARGRDFTEEDKNSLLDFHLDILKRIIPTYRQLKQEGKIDISFTPYFHPILPLLIDTDEAREAVSDITLPKSRFNFPEDALYQIKQSTQKYREIFDLPPDGMWPSEGSVSEKTLEMIKDCGLKWVATDAEILHYSVLKSKLNLANNSPFFIYQYGGDEGVKMFFRDHALSDKIGFVYSGWEEERAVDDFIGNLLNIKSFLSDKLDQAVVPIILDGENAWEYFPNDGNEFLSLLYKTLAEHNELEVVSLTEAAERLPAVQLPSVFSGSWINHNFRVWIGHAEDNLAWDCLLEARKKLVQFKKDNPQADPELIKKCWEQIYIAEGSDWCWWYGDDHIGAHNDQFDRLFRMHLISIYQLLNEKPPELLLRPIYRGQTESYVSMPEALVTPTLDGLLTHYYEWSGAGEYDCSSAGGAMHRVEKFISMIYFAFDNHHLYIRLDFDKKFNLVGKGKYRVLVDFESADPIEIDLSDCRQEQKGKYAYACDQILEIRIKREMLVESGYGQVKFFVTLYSGKELMEKWPIDVPISIKIPDKDKTIFWEI